MLLFSWNQIRFIKLSFQGNFVDSNSQISDSRKRGSNIRRRRAEEDLSEGETDLNSSGEDDGKALNTDDFLGFLIALCQLYIKRRVATYHWSELR